MQRLLAPALAGVLAVAVLYPVFTAEAAILHPVEETKITVSEACDAPATNPALVVRDQAGSIITQTTVGTQVLIEGTVNLGCKEYPDDKVTVLEVRNERTVTTFFGLQRISGSSEGQIVTGMSWMPDEPGTYEVRFTYTLCVSCPPALIDILERYEITVV